MNKDITSQFSLQFSVIRTLTLPKNFTSPGFKEQAKILI